MYKVWAKKIKNNKIIDSQTIKNNEKINLNEKRDKCLAQDCEKLDLSIPLLLKKHTDEFSEFKYIIFYPEDFIDDIDFDRLEFELLDDGTVKK